MIKTIHLKIRTVCGAIRAYPACETSQLLAKLTGHPTLLRRDLLIIQDLGYVLDGGPANWLDTIV